MQIVLSSSKLCTDTVNLLPSSYHERAESFSEHRKKMYLSGRSVVFESLKKFYGKNQMPEILAKEHGKPYFEDESYPRFNLSHSKDDICLAISENDTGIDLEYVRNRKNIDGLVDRVMGGSEKSYISKLDGLEKLQFFTAMWTVRECLIKLSGNGLSDLEKIQIDFDDRHIVYNELSSSFKLVTLSFRDRYPSLKDAYVSFIAPEDEVIQCYILCQGAFSPVALSSTDELYRFKVN
ncbi:MAG: 4'-phosphopantetheinyl transferase family protein [Succinivibrio sp.]